MAYDQARIDVEARYPSILEETLNNTKQEILSEERGKVQLITTEAQNLVKSEFDEWKHRELRLKQEEADTKLKQWEYERREEQQDDF